MGESSKKGMLDFELTREDIYISSKVPPTMQGTEKAKKSIDKSLADLDLEYIDLMLIQWPGAAVVKPNDPKNLELRHQTWQVMEEYVQKGLIKSIGVCNFRPNHLE